jgi:hypothetical protein
MMHDGGESITVIVDGKPNKKPGQNTTLWLLYFTSSAIPLLYSLRHTSSLLSPTVPYVQPVVGNSQRRRWLLHVTRPTMPAIMPLEHGHIPGVWTQG